MTTLPAPIRKCREIQTYYSSCESSNFDTLSYLSSLMYPDTWNQEPFKSTFLQETKESCCQVFFGAWGHDCKVVDVCDTSSCDNSAVWHPTADYSACSNSKSGYDDSWNHPPLRASYIHETAADCCSVFFEAWGKECIVENVCDS